LYAGGGGAKAASAAATPSAAVKEVILSPTKGAGNCGGEATPTLPPPPSSKDVEGETRESCRQNGGRVGGEGAGVGGAPLVKDWLRAEGDREGRLEPPGEGLALVTAKEAAGGASVCCGKEGKVKKRR